MKRRLTELFMIASVLLLAGVGCSSSTASPASAELPATEPPTTTSVPPAATQPPPTETPVPPTATVRPPRVADLNPSPRDMHHMAYDAGSDRTVLFGGITDLGRGRPGRDTWSYDLSTTTWQLMRPSLSPDKCEGAMAYDAESDRVILFVGALCDLSTRGSTWCHWIPTSETWAYDLDTNAWTDMEPAEAPHGPMGACMVYDAGSDRMILFGGWNPEISYDGGEFTETWAYDYDTNTWTKMEPVVSPPGRQYHAMAYDAGSDRVILWGGHGPVPVDVSSVWAYDYDADTWEELESSGAPSPIEGGAMAYDGAADRIILYAGSELWTFDYDSNTWTQLSDAPTPGLLKAHAMVYSDEADRVIVFGGSRSGDFVGGTNKTWVYDLNTDTWTDVTTNP